MPIYWDAHFRSCPLDVQVFDEFLRTLFESSWMTELGAHGIGQPRLLRSFVPARSPHGDLGRAELGERIAEWHRSGALAAVPQASQDSLFHLIVGPKVDEGELARTPDHCIVVPVTDTGGQMLEVHSRALCVALSTAFNAAARYAGSLRPRIPLGRTFSAAQSLPARR